MAAVLPQHTIHLIIAPGGDSPNPDTSLAKAARVHLHCPASGRLPYVIFWFPCGRETSMRRSAMGSRFFVRDRWWQVWLLNPER